MQLGARASASGVSNWRNFCVMFLGLQALLICVIAVQAAPAPIIVSTFVNTPVTGTVSPSAGGLINYSVKTDPVNGTVSLNTDGSFTYTPNRNYYGFDSFVYNATDIGGVVSEGIVNITILSGIPETSAVSVPSSGYYRFGDELNFFVLFDQSVSVSGSPFLPVTIGSTTRRAEYKSGSGTNILTFSYAVQPGDMDMDGIALGSMIASNGGSIRNAAGLDAILSLNNVEPTTGVLVNTSSPTAVITASSAPNDTVQRFTVTFSEAVTGLTVSDFVLTTSGSVTTNSYSLQTTNNLIYSLDIGVAGSGTLSLHLPAGGVVNAAGNENQASNALAVPVAQSSNADLQGITPSVGSLTPAFAPGIVSYTLHVANDVESIAFTPSLVDATATVVVNGSSTPNNNQSAAIPLAVGNNTITLAVTAQNGVTTKIYNINVVRAKSDNADLVSLVPSAGSFTPAFSPNATAYSLSVSTDTSSLRLTPTSADPTATITVNGTAVASGSATAALPLDIGNTVLSIIVTAQNGATRTYTVNVTRAVSADASLANLVPSIGSLDPTFDKDTLSYSLSVENTVENISFAPTVSDPSARATVAGANVLSGEFSRPVGLAIGSNKVSIVTTAPGGSSRTYSVVVNRAAIVFPDPALDAEVIGLLNAQTSAARRFAQVQTRNFQNRLEQLHNEGDRRQSSFGLRLGGQSSSEDVTDLNGQPLAAGSTNVTPLGYAPEKQNTFPSNAIAPKTSAQAPQTLDPNLGRAALWSSGFVNFGERDNGKLDLDYTLVGVSGGIDYRFSEQLVAGFGVGYGRDRTDIGNNGTESRANAYSVAIYGSYKPIDNFFIDGLLGGSVLDFDSRRFITSDGSLTNSKREGSQMFASLTAAYEFRQETWLVSPFGRMEMSRSWLDGYSEGGDSIYKLTYGDQTADTITGVLGLRANYSIDYSWGRLTPGVRAEYAHDFQGSSRATIGYSTIGGLPYALDVDGESSDSGSIGLSLDFSFDNAWSSGVEYRTGFGGSGEKDHAVSLKIGAKF